MRRVIIESPYRADPEGKYLAACVRDSVSRGEAPFASHRMYTSALDDRDMRQRSLGINCGFSWHLVAEYLVVYADLGITEGMREGIAYAEKVGLPIAYRFLGSGWDR